MVEHAHTHLARHPVLKLLHRNAAERLAPKMRHRTVRRGSVICCAGEAADAALSLDRAECMLMRPTGAAEDVAIGLAGPGAMVLLEDVLLGGSYSATGRALSAGAVWMIRREDLLAELASSPAARDAAAVHLARCARERNVYLGCVMGKSINSKIRRLLAYLRREHGDPHVRMTHADIAALLGASRQQVTQILHRLADAGEVGLGYGELLIGTSD